MKSNLKRLNIETIFEIINGIEDTNALTIEKVGPVGRLTIKNDIIDDAEDERKENRMGFLQNVLMTMDLESMVFNHLKNKDITLERFLCQYIILYNLSISSEKFEEYTNKILGNDSKNGCINVFIKDGNSFRPIICLLSYRNDYDLDTHKKYSEDEVLRLIESKEIVIKSNPLYSEMEDNFFCGIEDCSDIEDERVRKFTMKTYPFIYQELRDTISESKIDEDRIAYKNDRKEGLIEILKYYEEIKLKHEKKVKSLVCAQEMCFRKLSTLNTTSKNPK